MACPGLAVRRVFDVPVPIGWGEAEVAGLVGKRADLMDGFGVGSWVVSTAEIVNDRLIITCEDQA